ncbi:MAG: SDR family NAD(P)-dependent oxidoreductase [Rhodospirillaceae bacterium]
MAIVSPPTLNFTRLGPTAGTRMAVVGGCGGIGRALVTAARDIDLTVAVLDLSESLENYPPPKECLCVTIDANDEHSVTDAFAKLRKAWGSLDVLVNLCGYTNAFAPVAATSSESWSDVINGNLRSAFLCARAALPIFGENYGVIINTASGLAYKGMPGTSPYGAAKAGVIALSKSLAQECAPKIRVNVIAPGAVDTAFLRGGTSRGGEDPDKTANIDIDHYIQDIPLQRLATVEDVVGPILFLAGDAARFINGQVIHINGGGFMP